MDLAGKSVLITGAAVRLGRAMALAVAARGARVIVHYFTSRDSADDLVNEVRRLGSDAITVQADLRDIVGLPRLVDEGVKAFGHVDVLINSASIFERGTWDSTTEANWDNHFAINLKAPFFLCQAYAARLIEGQRGHIINMVDWRALRPGTGYMAYTMTKAALVTMTQSLALALAPNVQVNAIAPGVILPPPGEDESYLERLVPRIPARRVGSPEEITRTVLFLLESDFVTGDVIHVTGGEHLRT
ncbi:MAG TPA: SDR family oxidoreductase [Chloroflexi bacterium]|jgi:pteridine reductase|nr:SDR family oxidoreductase [Chloroflexota bacterium]